MNGSCRGIQSRTKTIGRCWNTSCESRLRLSYMAYTEQITFLVFLKMADEQSKPPYNKKIGVPEGLDWASLLQRDGEELERHYRKILDERARSPGCSGRSSKRRGRISKTPPRSAEGIVDSVDTENCSSWILRHFLTN